jgi:hypothetical protein
MTATMAMDETAMATDTVTAMMPPLLPTEMVLMMTTAAI